jgi:tetratricopeptide (TPR) repeat protein
MAELPQIPGYDLLKPLAEGGMGVVYLAIHRETKREVALKLVKDSSQTERSRQEVMILAALRHPNVVTIYELGDHDGTLYFTMEYIDGGTIAGLIGGRPQPPREAARIIEVLARTLDAIHHLGIIHRDLKPSNILLDRRSDPSAPRWVPKISDFGLAMRIDDGSLDPTGAAPGTFGYMAPEQAVPGLVGQIDRRVDIWALGVILYEMLTGRRPFKSQRGDRLEELTQLQTVDPVLPRTIPRGLQAICRKCLEKRRGDRYATAGALADDLRRWLAGEPIAAQPVSAATRALMWCRRNPMISALIVSVAAGSAGITWQWRKAVDKTRQLQAALVDKEIANKKTEVAKKRAEDEAGRKRRFAEAMADIFIGSDPIRFVTSLSNIAPGDVEAQTTKVLLDRAIKTFEGRPELEEDDPLLVAELKDAIGRVYCSLGNFDAARKWLEDAHAVRLEELGPGLDHADMAASLYSLGWLALGQGEHDKAEQDLRNALDARLRLYGERSPAVAETKFLLAWVLDEIFEYDESDNMFLQVIAIRERTPDQWRELAIAKLALAGSLVGQGRYREARKQVTSIPLAQSGLGAKLQAISAFFRKDADPLIYALTQFIRAMAIRSDDLQGAERGFADCLQSAREKLGEDHPGLAIIYYELGYTYELQAKYPQAEDCYVRSYRLVRDNPAVGLKHPRAIILITGYGRFLQGQGRPEEASRLYDDLIRARVAHYHHDHPLTADSLVLKADFLQYKQSPDPEQAQQLYREALEIYRKREGNRSAYRSLCLAGLARLLIDGGRADEAVPHLEAAWALELERKADDPWMLANVLRMLDEALGRSDKPFEVERILSLYRRGWPIIRGYPAGLPGRHTIAQRYEDLLRRARQDADLDEQLGISREPGVIEGEDLKIRGELPGGAESQDMRDWSGRWSGAYQLWWRDQDRGATLDLELPVSAATYHVVAGFTKAPNYGIARLSIDGQELKTINLYHQEVVPTGPVELGSVTLRDGPHVLTIRMIDTDPRGDGEYRYGFGLDWIKLTPTHPVRGTAPVFGAPPESSGHGL